ncbi:DUF5819 family protein [Aeromicrobium sp. 179-A 4D2 NHS]|uniref:DUF5819 family protein n=1 Tax=Aeromicrobium sp. 179-A 4D2 NHS TaxID=3142375 RepID=UPI0039A0B955
MSTSPDPPLSRSARITGLVALAVTAVVMLTTVLVVAPAGTPLRAEARSVALPYFGQNWRVFAPDILKTDRTLELRAQWSGPDGRPVQSDWVSVTDIEHRSVTGHVVPSRIAKSSWNAAGTYLQRYLALDEAQRDRARDSFVTADGEAVADEQLIRTLGEGDADVIRFLRLDYMLMRYATMYAVAGFGRPIEQVQWRIVRERPNDFQNRFVEERQFATATTTFGWRRSRVTVAPRVVQEYRELIRRHGAGWLFAEAAS